MTKEVTIAKLDRALSMVRQQISAGHADAYSGIDKVLAHLERMRTEVGRSGSTRDNSGIGRHVTDQWPFSDVAEAVLEAVTAYDRHPT